MYQFPENINLTHFFRMDKDLVMGGAWAGLPLASKSIYPTIAVHANQQGLAFPSQETIAIMTGCTCKTVREGLNGLMGFPGFRIDTWVTKRGQRAKTYTAKSPPKIKGSSIRIYRSFFDGGNWSQLLSVAQAVYPTILAFSYFDFDLYATSMDDSGEDWDYTISYNEFFSDGEYEQRKFDFAAPEIDVLTEYAGVSRRSVYSALDSLETNHFIQRVDEYWKVFLKPEKIFKREWLNSCANITY